MLSLVFKTVAFPTGEVTLLFHSRAEGARGGGGERCFLTFCSLFPVSLSTV